MIAAGLGSCVYMKKFLRSNEGPTLLCDVGSAGNDSITSVAFTPCGSFLVTGTLAGKVHFWDITRLERVRSIGGHRERVAVLAPTARLLSSGGRDGTILHHDNRSPSDFVSRLTGHAGEVCGLKWSPNERELASGASDNQLLVWNVAGSSGAPMHRFQDHIAAVKAIAWSPHQSGLLASGGGTLDQCIRFWDTNTGNRIKTVNTRSAVSNLAWSSHVNELVSTHGHPDHSVVVWRFSDMLKLAILEGAVDNCFRGRNLFIVSQSAGPCRDVNDKMHPHVLSRAIDEARVARSAPFASFAGHEERVLYLAASPNGQNIITGAGDETLRFWNIFPPAAATVSSVWWPRGCRWSSTHPQPHSRQRGGGQHHQAYGIR